MQEFKLEHLEALLGADDAKWFYEGCPIRFGATIDDWERKNTVCDKVQEAVASGALTPEPPKPEFIAPRVHVISDYLGGSGNIHGLQSMADGKMYDSKSQYMRHLKERGLEIVGNDEQKPTKPKLKEIDWHNAAAEAVKTVKKPTTK